MHFRNLPARFLAVSALLALASAAPLRAQSNLLVNNPSFEIPALQDGVTSVGIQNSPNTPLLNNWVVVGNVLPSLGNPGNETVLTSNPTDAQYLGTSLNSPFANPLNGVQVASFRTGLLTLTGSAVQVSNVVLALNTRFTLTVGVGNPLDSVFQGYNVSLIAGGTTLATVRYDPNNLVPPLDPIITTGTTVTDGTFSDKSVSFLFDPLLTPQFSNLLGTAVSVSLSVPFDPLATVPGNFGTDFDNVRLTTTVVPEPGTTACVGLGLLGLVGVQYARRRRGVSVRA